MLTRKARERRQRHLTCVVSAGIMSATGPRRGDDRCPYRDDTLVVLEGLQNLLVSAVLQCRHRLGHRRRLAAVSLDRRALGAELPGCRVQRVIDRAALPPLPLNERRDVSGRLRSADALEHSLSKRDLDSTARNRDAPNIRITHRRNAGSVDRLRELNSELSCEGGGCCEEGAVVGWGAAGLVGCGYRERVCVRFDGVCAAAGGMLIAGVVLLGFAF